MTAAYVDHLLAELLRAALVNDKDVASDLLGQSKPLGTFAARIDAAYLFGLLSSDGRRDLHIIRRIRNDFGHKHGPMTFVDKEVADRCGALRIDPLNTAQTPRQRFTIAAMQAVGSLHAMRIQAVHKSPLDNLVLTEAHIHMTEVFQGMVPRKGDAPEVQESQ